jgi:UDP:flavonoid glycosyltransferase YjiC (YdhE family)
MTQLSSNKDGGEKMPEAPVPMTMVEQAEAAMAAETDPSAMSPEQKRHMGHDVSIADATNAPAVDAEEQAVPPPAFGERYGDIRNDQDGFGTKASVTSDGRVNIRIDQHDRKVSAALLPTLKKLQKARDEEEAPPPPYIPPYLGSSDASPPPPLNVVIQIVGSRGDVQPFVALGKLLKETYGHRVRLATHPNFKDFVTENGLEFFSIGADPAALMAFMVKNPGLMPGFDALRAGDIGKRRHEVSEYLRGCWRSCYETGDGTGVEASDETVEDWLSNTDPNDYSTKPFVADCIIANPPSFAHIHIAEKMGIPCHCYFTMPYSPTQAFPHPLANIQTSNADENLTNYISYTLIEMLTWQGLGDVINRFRERSLGLEPISLMAAPGLLQRLRIPFTYCWSPALIPKPKDWGANINISGFFFLDLATNYTPDPELKAFLDAGPPPVYIGFGSIVLDDPNEMTKLIFEAVRKTGQRALVSKGWGGMGADELGKPDNVFMLGNCPHDWLFKQVSCVVHHGGAGTTAAGITAGRPTVVVPFFGDQPFWGSMVARAGAGPPPIPNKQLTADNLAEAIMKCLEPASQEKAHELAAKIATEKGTDEGAKSFHQFLEVDKLRCNLSPSRVAVWRVKRTQVRLSAMAACTLANEGLLDFNDLKLFRAKEYETDEGPWDPITGGAGAIIGTASTMMLGIADFPIETLKALKIHPDATKAKKESNITSESTQSSGPSSRTMSRRGSEAMSSSDADTRSISTVSGSTVVPSQQGTLTPMTSSHSNSSFNFQDSLSRMSSGTLSPTQSIVNSGKLPSSMADALNGNLSKSRQRSSSRPRSPNNANAAGGNGDLLRTTFDTGKGVQRIVGAGLKSPMDFTLGVARGFHNAPKLYGDETVRKADQVTDFKSGVKAAAKGFGLGMFDGITGLVSQPIQGAQKEGPAGFFKGIGKGIGGIVFKPSAAIFSIPGYTMMGVYKEMQKVFGSSVQGYIIAARTAQGYDEWQRSDVQERRLVIERWKEMQMTLKKKRNPDELVRQILQEQARKKDVWVDSKKAERAEKRRSRGPSMASSKGNAPFHDPESAMLAIEIPKSREAEERALQEAIRQSVQQTSEGNQTEDARVEQGIRESMRQYLDQNQPSDHTDVDDESLNRALAESSADAERHKQTQIAFDKDLERVLTASLKEQRGWPDDNYESEAGPSSQQQQSAEAPPQYDHLYPNDDEGGLNSGAAAGKKPKQPPTEKTAQEKSEEQIVLEYAKKQSLLEEELRRSKASGGSAAGPSRAGEGAEDDEDLRRAISLSMEESQARQK